MVNGSIKVCFVGLGSIGRRHLKNIKKYANLNNIDLVIHALRSKHTIGDINKSSIQKEFYVINEMEEDYDIIFITNPTSLHFDSVSNLVKKCKNMFIEKPIFDHYDYNIDSIDFRPDGKYYIAAPMRFTDVFQYLKENIDPNSIISSRIICSSYMPNWQKGRDYRKSFRVDEKRGGGVDIDLIHEIDYMVDYFGMPKRVYRSAGKFSILEMEACDLAMYQFTYQNRLVQVLLDYFGRVDKREIELYTNDEVIVGDFIKKEIRYIGRNEVVVFDKEIDHYYREMEYFMSYISGQKDHNINNVNKALTILKLSKGEI
ncbi:MAG: Gfo/Idh/MocA family oxidoreductase [Clostridia bacterium]|nr:Gfo/Idh/MocA family oxidoreductase [Clostridia bacterium]